jgi:hypothetical protein
MKKLCVVVMSLVPALALAQTPPAPAKGAPPAAAPAKAAPAAPPAKAPAKAEPAAPPAPPPAPPEVKATVDAFKGNWKFETTMTATGIPGMDKPATSKMTFNCKAVAGGTAVSCDSKMKTPMGPFDALFVVTYDPYSKAVHFMGITNMHEVHDHVCAWAGNDLNCKPLKGGMGPGGDEITEDLTMTFDEKRKNVSFKSVSKMTKGGGTMTFEGKGKK